MPAAVLSGLSQLSYFFGLTDDAAVDRTASFANSRQNSAICPRSSTGVHADLRVRWLTPRRKLDAGNPLLGLVMWCMARNQVRSGNLVAAKIVAAIGEVCRGDRSITERDLGGLD